MPVRFEIDWSLATSAPLTSFALSLALSRPLSFSVSLSRSFSPPSLSLRLSLRLSLSFSLYIHLSTLSLAVSFSPTLSLSRCLSIAPSHPPAQSTRHCSPLSEGSGAEVATRSTYSCANSVCVGGCGLPPHDDVALLKGGYAVAGIHQRLHLASILADALIWPTFANATNLRAGEPRSEETGHPPRTLDPLRTLGMGLR